MPVQYIGSVNAGAQALLILLHLISSLQLVGLLTLFSLITRVCTLLALIYDTNYL